MASSTIFDISNKALKLDTADDVKAHTEELTKSTSFTEIHLNGNTIGIPAAQYLATLLKTQKSLQHVQFADIFTGRLLSEIPEALDALLSALLELPQLHTVNLSDNAFGLSLVAELTKFLKAHVPLQHLILNNNGMGPLAGSQIADALTELASRKDKARKEGKSVPDLETIVCGRNRLETGSMEAWAKAYTALGKVKTVRMTQNGIRQEGIVLLLTKGLVNCKSLEVVDLQDNTFTVTGGKALAKVISEWSQLKELGVGDCLVSSRGFVAVTSKLEAGSNKKLQTLRAQFNEINAKGLAGVLAAAEGGGLPELRRVELNGNQFSEDDEKVEQLKSLLDGRREAAGVEDEEDETWGLDELDEMEDEEEDEEEDDDDEAEDEQDDTEAKAEKEVKDTEKAEQELVAQERDLDVDALADSLGKKLTV